MMEGLSVTFSAEGAVSSIGNHRCSPPGDRQRAADNHPHSRPARNPAVSLGYFGFHWLEFFLGSHLRLRPITFRGGLVLIDRYYYDFFVDQRRYRLRVPQPIVRLGHFFLKKPDLVVLLTRRRKCLQAASRRFRSRKPNASARRIWNLSAGLSNGRVVDATQPPEKVGADINRAILDFMAERTSKRWGIGHS